jgi:hypothetical protein
LAPFGKKPRLPAFQGAYLSTPLYKNHPFQKRMQNVVKIAANRGIGAALNSLGRDGPAYICSGLPRANRSQSGAEDDEK